MKVKQLIEKLQQYPQDEEVYLGRFCGFLNDSLEHVYPQGLAEIPDKESYELFSLDCDRKAVFCWSVKRQKQIEYTGVIIEMAD